MPGENLLLISWISSKSCSAFGAQNQQGRRRHGCLIVNLILYNAVDQSAKSRSTFSLTMRTYFLGECAQLRGLPESATNDVTYPGPPLTRIQQQEAIGTAIGRTGRGHHAFTRTEASQRIGGDPG